MTYDEIKGVVGLYDIKLGEMGYQAERCDGKCAIAEVRLKHVRWMCQEICRMLSDPTNMDLDDGQKIHRWLGFIQGVFFTDGIFSIQEMKEHNRPGGYQAWIERQNHLP